MKYIGGGWTLGVGGKPKAGIHKETNHNAVSSVSTETATVNLVGRDGCQQQFDTPCSPNNAPQWLHVPYSGLSWSYRIGKLPPVKADLAIYIYYIAPSLVCLDSARVWLSCYNKL